MRHAVSLDADDQVHFVVALTPHDLDRLRWQAESLPLGGEASGFHLHLLYADERTDHGRKVTQLLRLQADGADALEGWLEWVVEGDATDGDA